MSETVETTGRRGDEGRAAPFKWGFGSAALVVLSAMVMGQVLGKIVERLHQVPGPFGAREWLLVAVLCGFAISLGTYVVLQRGAVARFFRSMYAGVALVVLSLVAVMTGVLVPQITGFEDASERIPSIRDIKTATFDAYVALPDERNSDLAPDQLAQARARANTVLAGLDQDQRDRIWKYREEYQAFRWAEGYFVFHLLRPYGIGMPPAPPLIPRMLEGLERFEKKYGKEERQNREKSMRAAFNGHAVSQAIGASIHAHEKAYRTAFEVATFLDLNRTYKSNWFLTLMVLLCSGVLANTFKGNPATWLSMRKVGYMTVHLGVMTILIGGAISKSLSVRGILQMEIGKAPKGDFWAYNDPKKPRWMPFSLQLDRFARRDWKTLQVEFTDEQFASNPPEYTLWPGRKVDLDFAPDSNGIERPRIRLEVLSLHERARALPSEFSEAKDAGDPYAIGALAEFSLPRTDGARDGDAKVDEETFQLSPLMRERSIFYDPDGKFRLLVHNGGGVAAAQEVARAKDDGRIGLMSMRVGAQGDVEPTVAPIRVGDTLHAPGGYTLEIVRAAPNFALDRNAPHKEVIDPRPLAEQLPSNPAVIVRIRSDADGSVEERPVLEHFDYEAEGLQSNFQHSDLVLNLQWDLWTAPGPERRVLHWDSAAAPILVAPDGSQTALLVGDALALPGTTRITLKRLFDNAHIERRVDLDPGSPVIQGPQFEASFYSSAPTGSRIRVTTDPGTPQEKVQTVDLASAKEGFANTWFPSDKRFYLSYYNNDKTMPFEWRSVLSVWERDADGNPYKKAVGPEHDREIRVNDYFEYRGYRFFQSNADPKVPTYSGIGVVYDPGIPFVLFGMYLTIVGAVLRFIIRPIVESYSRRTQAVQA